jgi:hypothetical protein
MQLHPRGVCSFTANPRAASTCLTSLLIRAVSTRKRDTDVKNLAPRARSRSPRAQRWQLAIIAGAVLSAGGFALALAAPANAAVMEQASWDVSNNQTAVASTTYTYEATVVSAAVIGSVTIALPDAPTVAPTLGSIFGIGAGTLSTVNNMIVYTVNKPVIVPTGTNLYLQFSGITNTTRQGWFSSIITTMSAGAKPIIVDAGQTSDVAFLSHDNAPDFTVARAVTVRAAGLSITVASAHQGYAVSVDPSFRNSTNLTTATLNGVQQLWSPAATGALPDLVTLVLPSAAATAKTAAAAIHLTVWPAY